MGPITVITAIATALTILIVKFIMAPPIKLKAWSPFKIDALGIVTLLGADAIRKALGRLVHSLFEYFPLLAGHIFAYNSVMEPVPGLVLYNITEGVIATDLSAWFTRWLLCQKLSYNSTRLEIQASRHISGLAFDQWLPIGLVTIVVVRTCILYDFRSSIDKGVEGADTTTRKKLVKLFITLPNGSRLTAVTTTGIAQHCLLTEARTSSEKMHMIARTVCCLAFGIQTVTLGMACLAVQLFLVTLTLMFSVAIVQGWLAEGWNSSETCIDNRLVIKQRNDGGVGSMASVYALLDLTEEEEQNMIAWPIFPTQNNKLWLRTYRKFKEDAKRDPTVLGLWGERMRQAHAEANAKQQAG